MNICPRCKWRIYTICTPKTINPADRCGAPAHDAGHYSPVLGRYVHRHLECYDFNMHGDCPHWAPKWHIRLIRWASRALAAARHWSATVGLDD